MYILEFKRRLSTFPAEADPGGRVEGVAAPLWEVFKVVWLPMSISFSY